MNNNEVYNEPLLAELLPVAAIASGDSQEGDDDHEEGLRDSSFKL